MAKSPSLFSQKSSIIDVWLGPKYTTAAIRSFFKNGRHSRSYEKLSASTVLKIFFNYNLKLNTLSDFPAGIYLYNVNYKNTKICVRSVQI